MRVLVGDSAAFVNVSNRHARVHIDIILIGVYWVGLYNNSTPPLRKKYTQLAAGLK